MCEPLCQILQVLLPFHDLLLLLFQLNVSLFAPVVEEGFDLFEDLGSRVDYAVLAGVERPANELSCSELGAHCQRFVLLDLVEVPGLFEGVF